MPNININTTQKYLDKVSKRTKLLSKPIEDTSNKNKTEFIFFSLQKQTFAIPSLYAIEVVTEFSLQEFEFLPKFLKGLINVRGNVIPVNDLSNLIFEQPLKKNYEVIRIKYRNIDTSFAVDEVNNTDLVFNDLIVNNTTYKYTKNCIKNDDGTYTPILDLQAFFSDEGIIVNE